MKRLFSFLLVFAILLTMVPITGVRAETLDISGDLNSEKPTKMQIWEKWNAVTYASTLFDEDPSISAPYAPGELSDDFLESGITSLNYVRYVANLPQVQLNAALNENAQYGAVLLAANDTLTHYPDQPADMDDDFYSKGYDATTSSNISARWGYAPLTCLQGSVFGCMDDSSSLSNLETVGHRRWLLNPQLLNVGFGYAQSASNASYITTKIFDQSGNGCDYNFISWPASGNFPTNLININTPWSVTLNLSKYQKPVLDNLKITLTRESDGKQWTFDAATGSVSGGSGAYLTVNNNYYGVPNCIIFRPNTNELSAYEGIYTVKINGLYTAAGQKTTLCYQVDFFNVNVQPVSITKQPKSVSVAEGERAKVTVKASGEGLSYKWYYKNKGSSKFSVSDSYRTGTYSVPMTAARAGRQVYCVITDKYGYEVKTKVVTLGMETALQIMQQPKNVTVAEGETAKITVKASGEGLSYKWYYKNKGSSKFSASDSYKTGTYSVSMTAARAGRQVYCVITDKYGNQVTSQVVTLGMQTPLKITQQPKSVTVAKGETAKVTVKATGDGLTYRWYYKNAGSSSYTYTDTFKGNTYKVSMNAARDGRRLLCRVYDAYGNVVQTKTVVIRMK